jgi:hypothetical protein
MNIKYSKAMSCWVSFALGNIISYWFGLATETQMVERILFQGIAIFAFAYLSNLEITQ